VISLEQRGEREARRLGLREYRVAERVRRVGDIGSNAAVEPAARHVGQAPACAAVRAHLLLKLLLECGEGLLEDLGRAAAVRTHAEQDPFRGEGEERVD